MTTTPAPSPTTPHVSADPSTPLGFCLTMLEGLISGVEAGSEIPVHINELRTLQQLITRELANRPAKLSVYPTMDSTQSVMDLAKSQFPPGQYNQVRVLMCTYHNTLLETINKGK